MDTHILDHERQRSPLDFDSVSKAELEVFGLIVGLVPALNEAYCRFMRMVDNHSCSDATEEAQKKQDLETFAEKLEAYGGAYPANDANLCALFMSLHCDLPFDQAFLWHRRVEAQQWRQGLRAVYGVPISEQYAALQSDTTNKLTQAVRIRPDGSTVQINAEDVPF